MLQTHRRNRRIRTAVMVIALLAAGVSTIAAEKPAVLVVPPHSTTLQVAVDLPRGVAATKANGWRLVEIDDPDTKIVAELGPAIAADGTVSTECRRLVAEIPPRDGADRPRRFRLEPVDEKQPVRFRFDEVDDKSLKLSDEDKPVLVYNHGLITDQRVPPNDHRRSRACYVHPVWGLNGEVLTDDFPKDHYHHHGIFWTWPHVKVDGKEHDLWLGNTIRDEFVRRIGCTTGSLSASLAVENGWFVEDKKVMVERVWLRVHKVSDDSRCLDFEFTWIPTDRPVTLWGAGGKSYGGLTVRFAPRSRGDTVITVPSGRTEADLPETALKWADFTSKFGDAAGPSGGAIFVHPDHPDYPPTWLTRHYGPLCIGWPGVKPKTLEPGEPVRLCYRIWLHKSAVDVERLKRAYEDYIAATKVTWE